MKKALVYVVDSLFKEGFMTSLYSFLFNNKKFDGDIIVFDIELDELFKKEIKEVIKNKFNKEVFFKEIQFEKYKDMSQENVLERFNNTIYKLEMFSLYDYDVILYLDSDTLVIENVEELFCRRQGIEICCDFKAKKGEFFEDRYNTGVLVIHKDVLNPEIYNSLLMYTLHNFSNNLPDQQPINDFFKKDFHNLPPIYNYFKAIKAHKKFDTTFPLMSVRIIHFYIKKPWQAEHKDEWMYNKIRDLYILWNQYNKAIKKYITPRSN